MSENPQIALNSLNSWCNAVAAPVTTHGFCGLLFRHGFGQLLCNSAAQTFVYSRTSADLCGCWNDSPGLGAAVCYGTVRGAIPGLQGWKLRAFLWRNSSQKCQESMNLTLFGLRGTAEQLLGFACAKQSCCRWRKSQSWGPFNFSYLGVWIPADVPSPALLGAHGGSW